MTGTRAATSRSPHRAKPTPTRSHSPGVRYTRRQGGIMKGKPIREWLGKDRNPRDVPAYGITEAARYLRLPEAALRA